MKTIKTVNKKTLCLAVVALGLTGVLSSCSKHDDDDVYASGSVDVMVVNGNEASAPQNFYLDDAKINGSAVAYTEATSYVKTRSGNRKGEFRSSVTGQVNTSATYTIQKDRHYTFYYTGNASASDAVMTEDDLSSPSSGKAKVRYVHLSTAAASNVDVAVQGGAKLISNLAYKSATAFSEIEAGTYNLQLLAAGTANVALSIPNITFQAGKIYTVYVSGATSATISYHVIVNQ
ncbi:DUF4397 domain-containing protein [Pedobacter sp. BS3]|uniref:DUF4397 domain-containing protein n=1 Tax=Pedobacter sp. BS3 TaxID=2567937 RepID=UPI001659B87E|nr:DUF4397 domain-containing protein [Pedobacter sp. BS3]